jgi:aspartyl-tRNA(Asn)/glutamyl-tRNA(Gln) amidotransferase subunit C
MDQDELRTTIELAQLELSPDEEQRVAEAVAELLEHFDLMGRYDVSSLEPTTHALSTVNRSRPDTPLSHPVDPDALLEQAPDLEDRFISIPNVL